MYIAQIGLQSMDLGNHEDDIPMPISAQYAAIQENAKLKLLASGNGTPAPAEPFDAKVKRGAVRYRECQKNHAASIGGHAIDGCGEFMPCGEDGTIDGLKCAACDCHRNFHRREVEGEPSCDCHHRKDKKRPPLILPSGRESDDQEGLYAPVAANLKKRFRTKFTGDQKDKMLAFAEKLGWRIQKHDEAEVQQFCNETGVKRHVLKVWMHNNKHTLGKKLEESEFVSGDCHARDDLALCFHSVPCLLLLLLPFAVEKMRLRLSLYCKSCSWVMSGWLCLVASGLWDSGCCCWHEFLSACSWKVAVMMMPLITTTIYHGCLYFVGQADKYNAGNPTQPKCCMDQDRTKRACSNRYTAHVISPEFPPTQGDYNRNQDILSILRTAALFQGLIPFFYTKAVILSSSTPSRSSVQKAFHGNVLPSGGCGSFRFCGEASSLLSSVRMSSIVYSRFQLASIKKCFGSTCILTRKACEQECKIATCLSM